MPAALAVTVDAAASRPLVVPPALLAEIIMHLRSVLPEEGCGLLAERARLGGGWEACRYFPGVNVDRSPHRFTMDPRAVVDALREIDARGWRLAAIVHSHPAGPAAPSPTDLREAYYPDAAFLIVGFGGEAASVRAWRFAGRHGPIVEVAVATNDEDRATRADDPDQPGAPA